MVQKILTTGLLCAVTIALGACGGHSSPSAGVTPAGSPASTPRAGAPSSEMSKTTDGAPVELIYSGITDDKANLSYRIRVNTDRPIDEIHLALKEVDSKGKARENNIIWQNIVGSTRKPIESGKTYEDQTPLDSGTASAEASLKEVIFKDGSRWTAR